MTTDAGAQVSGLHEYLQQRLRAFLLHVASAGLAVSEQEAMRNNAAQWTRDYYERDTKHGEDGKLGAPRTGAT